MNTKYFALLSLALIPTLYGWSPEDVKKFEKTGECHSCDFTNHPNLKELFEKVRKHHPNKQLDLRNSKFHEANAFSADLSSTQLAHTQWQKAKINRANFSNAILRHANLSNTFALFANFTGASLQVANFQKANLQGAIFDRAQFSWEEYSTKLYKAQLSFIAQPKSIKVDNKEYTNLQEIKEILQKMVNTPCRVTFD